jgi:hypothetical protein
VVSARYEAGDGSDEANNDRGNAGAAYIFTRSGETWSQQAYLKASNISTADQFGDSVAIDGDTVIVGAPQEDSDGSGEANNDAGAAGAAYIFARSGITWTQQAYLKADNAAAGDMFGDTVAVSGDTVVVGAPGQSTDGPPMKIGSIVRVQRMSLPALPKAVGVRRLTLRQPRLKQIKALAGPWRLMATPPW